MNNISYTPVQTTPFSVSEKIKQRLWEIIQGTVFRYSPFFARKFRVFLLNLFGAKISYSCSVESTAFIYHPWKLSMGFKSSLGRNSYISCEGGVNIGQYVCVGRDVNILSGSHNISSKLFEMIISPITIKDGAWIATGAYVLPGISIGNSSVVGAASMVTKDVPDNMVAAGNPVRLIKKRFLEC